MIFFYSFINIKILKLIIFFLVLQVSMANCKYFESFASCSPIHLPLSDYILNFISESQQRNFPQSQEYPNCSGTNYRGKVRDRSISFIPKSHEVLSFSLSIIPAFCRHCLHSFLINCKTFNHFRSLFLH